MKILVPHIFCGQKCEQGHKFKTKLLKLNRNIILHNISSRIALARFCVPTRRLMHDLFSLETLQAKKIHFFTFFVDNNVMKHVQYGSSH